MRRRLAAEVGCDAEEIAITRNASEALQIAQLGIDLQAAATRCSPPTRTTRGCSTTWHQRERRDGIMLDEDLVPGAAARRLDELARALRARDHAAHRSCIHVCHITNLTGQIFPVPRDLRGWRAQRGIQTIVDGAHAFAHFPFKLRDLECDYYGTSLHKWLLAPIGTGFLYVRREKIRGDRGR